MTRRPNITESQIYRRSQTAFLENQMQNVALFKQPCSDTRFDLCFILFVFPRSQRQPTMRLVEKTNGATCLAAPRLLAPRVERLGLLYALPLGGEIIFKWGKEWGPVGRLIMGNRGATLGKLLNDTSNKTCHSWLLFCKCVTCAITVSFRCTTFE